jgi:hypothetical protein
MNITSRTTSDWLRTRAVMLAFAIGLAGLGFLAEWLAPPMWVYIPFE